MKENMHRVGSKSGRRKPRSLGMNDKGTQRDSSMGKSFRRGGPGYARSVR